MNVIETKVLNNGLTQGTLEFEGVAGATVTSKVYMEDFAWGMKCILEGATQKVHAGCFFHDDDDDIVILIEEGALVIDKDTAAEFVEEWR